MADVYKVLGQTNPGAGYTADLYRAPAYAGTVVSALTVCNLGSNSTSFSIAVRPLGLSTTTKNYINYNTIISANDTIALAIGITLAQNDVITVSSAAGTVSFIAFGSETSTLPLVIAPVINSFSVTDNTYNIFYGTGVPSSGGYIKIKGSNFSLLSRVFVAGQAAILTIYISSSELWAQLQPRNPGTYSLMVFNGTGGPGTVRTGGIDYTASLPSSAPSFTTVPSTIVPVDGVYQFTAVGGSQLSYAVTVGSLPAGATLSSGGLLNTSVAAPGVSTFTITATDLDSVSSSKALTLIVPLQLNWLFSSGIIVNTFSSLPVSVGPLAQASYGNLNYTITSGSLSSGLSLNANTGIISGNTNLGVGTVTSNVTVTANSTLASYTASNISRSFSTTVTTPTITWAYANNSTLGTVATYSSAAFNRLATADYGSLNFVVTTGSLPSGLSIGSSTGIISGTPAFSAIDTTSTFTVTVTGQYGFTGSRSFSISVIGSVVTWAYADNAALTGITSYATVTYLAMATADVGTLAFTVASGSLPLGLSINSSTGVISGIASYSGNNTTSNFTIAVTGQYGYSGSRSYSIAVAVPATSMEVLVVASGGRARNTGGAGSAGTGGAGGLVYGTTQSDLLFPTPGSSMSIVVGAQVGVFTTSSAAGAVGNNSSFGNIVAFGGGAGGGGNGGAGGSGAGSGTLGGTGGNSTQVSYAWCGLTGYGNKGGSRASDASGGGGAGGVGGTGNSTAAGGAGLSVGITGTSVVYAQGGAFLGGGAYVANDTIGGGGSTRGINGGSFAHGPGNAGIVIIAYPSDQFGPLNVSGVTYTLDTASRPGYNIYSFTAGSGTVTSQ